MKFRAKVKLDGLESGQVTEGHVVSKPNKNTNSTQALAYEVFVVYFVRGSAGQSGHWSTASIDSFEPVA